jgi:urea carboxylase
MSARYSWGGDEFVFVELAEEMSLQANFKAMAITKLLQAERPDGILEICPANASYQVRYDPDVLEPHAFLAHLKGLEERVGDALGVTLDCRVVEIPVLYRDPWTTETLMRFRDRHQDPDATDIEYAARINGYGSVEEFIAVHSGSPWFTSMVGFVAGLPFKYQMVPRERQILVPSTCARAPTPRSRPSATAAASPASTRSAAPAATRCSASPRPRSTTRRRPSRTSPRRWCSCAPVTS